MQSRSEQARASIEELCSESREQGVGFMMWFLKTTKITMLADFEFKALKF